MDLKKNLLLIKKIIFNNIYMKHSTKKMNNDNGKKMSWIEALKKWNKDKGGKYEIPKKGSSGYNEVKALMK